MLSVAVSFLEFGTACRRRRDKDAFGIPVGLLGRAQWTTLF